MSGDRGEIPPPPPTTTANTAANGS